MSDDAMPAAVTVAATLWGYTARHATAASGAAAHRHHRRKRRRKRSDAARGISLRPNFAMRHGRRA